MQFKGMGAGVVVLGAPVVCGAVEFDDEFLLHREEIGDINSDRDLPPELETLAASVTQSLPEGCLGSGGAAAELAGAFSLFGGGLGMVFVVAHGGFSRASEEDTERVGRVYPEKPSPPNPLSNHKLTLIRNPSLPLILR